MHAGLSSSQQKPVAAVTAGAQQQARAMPARRGPFNMQSLSATTQKAMAEARTCRIGGLADFAQRIAAFRAAPVRALESAHS